MLAHTSAINATSDFADTSEMTEFLNSVGSVERTEASLNRTGVRFHSFDLLRGGRGAGGLRIPSSDGSRGLPALPAASWLVLMKRADPVDLVLLGRAIPCDRPC